MDKKPRHEIADQAWEAYRQRSQNDATLKSISAHQLRTAIRVTIDAVSPAAELTDAIERANARLIAYPELVAELSDEHLELIQRIEKRLGWIESGLEINEIDFAKDIRSLLARSPAQPQERNSAGETPTEHAHRWAADMDGNAEVQPTCQDCGQQTAIDLVHTCSPQARDLAMSLRFDRDCPKCGAVFADCETKAAADLLDELVTLPPVQPPAQSEQDKRDAERYRWLRNPDHDVALAIDKRTGWVPPDDAVPGVGGYWTYEYRAGEELDATIDAAMQAQKKESGNGE